MPNPADVQSFVHVVGAKRHRYAYVLNNPLKYRDPTGHTPQWWDDLVNGFQEWLFMLNPCNFMTSGCLELPSIPSSRSEAMKEAVKESQDLLNQSLLGGECLSCPDLERIATAADVASRFIQIAEWSSQLPDEIEPNQVGDWGAEQVESNLPVEVAQIRVRDATGRGQDRIYDGRLNDRSRFVEIKTSLSANKASIGIDRRIRREASFDARQDDKPMWIFVAKPPSRGLQKLLNEYGIPWLELNVSPPDEKE